MRRDVCPDAGGIYQYQPSRFKDALHVTYCGMGKENNVTETDNKQIPY